MEEGWLALISGLMSLGGRPDGSPQPLTPGLMSLGGRPASSPQPLMNLLYLCPDDPAHEGRQERDQGWAGEDPDGCHAKSLLFA